MHNIQHTDHLQPSARVYAATLQSFENNKTSMLSKINLTDIVQKFQFLGSITSINHCYIWLTPFNP